MHKMSCWRGGITILGIILSLPYALLMWASVAFVLLILDNVLIAWCSMFFFALALFYVIFQTTDPASLSVMILGTVLVTSIISLPTWWGRDYGNFTEWLSDLRCRFWQRRSREQGSV